MQGLFVLYYDDDTYNDLHQPAVIVGGCFAIVAVTLSLFLVFQHLRSYTNPDEQKWIVAVIFMVPVYAIESILSLANPKFSLACDILRNCYEAFALYSFGSYLIACLGGERRVMDFLESESCKQLNKPLLEGRSQGHGVERRSFIHFFSRPCLLGRDLFTIERFGLVQYMILKTLCALLAFILELFGVYGDGEFKWYYGYPYIAVVMNFSQMWALFCLVQFYNVTHERLKPIKPLAKFISFKAIVFATWWQGVGIALLCAFRVLPNEGKFRTGLQDFLICIEYNYIPASEHGKVTAKTSIEEITVKGTQEEPAIIEKKDALVEAPGTSVRESVQDIVIRGGQRVVKDVVLTINQAIGPVEKGVTKIQETFHHRTESRDKEESEFTAEEINTEKSVGN